MRAGQQCNFPNTVSSRSRAAGSQQVCNSPLTVWKRSLWPTKRVKSLALPTDSHRQREMPSLKCKWGVLQAGSTKLAELFLSHLLGGTSRSSSRWERWICGVPPTSTQTKAAAVLHLTPFPGVKGVVFKSFPPHYPRASGTQPCDITEADCPISPRALCALGCWVPQSLLWSLSLFHLFYTCLCRYIETNCFVFSCLQESLISVRPLLPITPVTHHWRQEHRDCRKIYIYIYIHNWIQFYVFKFRKNASHIHTKIHQENTRGKTLPTARNTQKSTVIATVTFFWGVYSIEETSLCTGESQILQLIFLCQLVWIKSVKFLLLKKCME